MRVPGDVVGLFRRPEQSVFFETCRDVSSVASSCLIRCLGDECGGGECVSH